MKKTITITVFLFIAFGVMADNPVLTNSYSTHSSGYLVGIPNYGTAEIKKVDVAISDIVNVVKEHKNNPKLKNTTSTHYRGYLVGIDSWSNPEIKKVEIAIEDVAEIVKDYGDLKKEIKSLKNENDYLKKQLDNQKIINQALYEYVGFTPPVIEPVSIQSPAKSNLNIYNENDAIVIENATGKIIYVYDLEGKLLFSTKLSDDMVRIPVEKGIYLVQIENDTTKILVY